MKPNHRICVNCGKQFPISFPHFSCPDCHQEPKQGPSFIDFLAQIASPQRRNEKPSEQEIQSKLEAGW